MKPSHPSFLLLALAPACFKETAPTEDTGVDTGVVDTATDDWPEGEPTLTWDDDLASGAPLDLDWADLSSVACWPGTEDSNFDGAHVLFQGSQGADRDLYVRVTPEPGLDVSLYAMQFGGDIQAPPDVSSCVTCEASADWIDDSNPGVEEEVYLSGFDPYEVLIGVAGAGGAVTGGFGLELWDVENPW